MTEGAGMAGSGAPPRAVALPEGRARLPRLLPWAALLLAAWLAWRGWGGRGPTIVIHAREGHGVAAGDALRYRGIDVGRVRAVRLGEDLTSMCLEVELLPDARAIARVGSRFWIVRPRLTLDEVSGLETVIGARYLKVLPGPPAAARQLEFVALDEPPVVEELEPGGLEVRLEARSSQGIAAGAPIRYRGLEVGRILSVGLSSDASHVDLRGWIFPDYARLVRVDSVFWETGGLEAELELVGGLRFELDSLRGLLVGAVAFASPSTASAGAGTGQRFELHTEPREDWLEWSPQLPVGNSLLPAGATLPEPLRVALRWRAGKLWKRDRERIGWSLLVEDGLVLPAELAAPAGDGDERRLEVAGAEVPIAPPLAEAGGVARIAVELSEAAPPWPRSRVRTLEGPEELLLVSDSAQPAIAISAARLDDDLRIDPSLSLDESWLGAAVLARADGMLVGILLVRDGARVAPVP